MTDTPPLLSIIVPCYNEAATISLLLEAVMQQTFDLGQMEVVIADGMSSDNTRQVIQQFQAAHPELIIRLVDNPRRIIPAALNTAIHAARGTYIIRLDAHCMPYPDYIERCLRALGDGLGTTVGGVWEIHPFALRGQHPSAVARSIAAAAAHPLGVGDAYYRYATQAQAVDTVPFGAYARQLIDTIGGFDETLLTNEDYEFNVRVRQSGGVVWLDPSIRSIYFARPTFAALARQYWRYGYWKARMLRRYAQTLRWRQALPPAFVASLSVLALLSPFLWLARLLLAVLVGIYLLVLLAAGARTALAKKDLALLPGMPLAIATMHFTWGSGLLASLISGLFTRERPHQQIAPPGNSLPG